MSLKYKELDPKQFRNHRNIIFVSKKFNTATQAFSGRIKKFVRNSGKYASYSMKNNPCIKIMLVSGYEIRSNDVKIYPDNPTIRTEFLLKGMPIEVYSPWKPNPYDPNGGDNYGTIPLPNQTI
jgi:hypothetical protein